MLFSYHRSGRNKATARVVLLLVILITKTCGVLAQESAAPPDVVADFVWSEVLTDGSRILHSRYSKGVWSSPEIVFEDAGLHILPAIAAIGADDRLVTWSKVDANGITLRYSRYTKDPNTGQNNWDKGKTLPTTRTVNLAAVLLANEGSYQAYWSAHEGNDDDILSARLQPGGWTAPVQIHDNNAEVDTLPKAGFDPDGRVWVSWESIGTRAVEDRVFVYETKRSFGKPRSLRRLDLETLEKESLELIDIEPPVFFKSKSRAVMYIQGDFTHPIRLFPGNLS